MAKFCRVACSYQCAALAAVLLATFAFSHASQLHHVLAVGTESHTHNPSGNAVDSFGMTTRSASDGVHNLAASEAPQSSAPSQWWSAFQNIAALQREALKPLWPLDGRDIAMLAILAFSLSLAGGAGIGGGAILVPTFILVRRKCRVELMAESLPHCMTRSRMRHWCCVNTS